MDIKELKKRIEMAIEHLSGQVITDSISVSSQVELDLLKTVLVWIDEDSLPVKRASDNCLFDIFWENYPGPRKKDKPKSRKLFNKQDRETQELIINHIMHRQDNDNEWTKSNGDFIPGPVPFLNQNGWTDEYRVNELSRFDAKTQKSVGALQEFVNG